MRKIVAFSANFNGRVVHEQNADTSRETKAFADIHSHNIESEDSYRETKEFMTPTIIKMTLVEMKRRPNIRFMRLVKSAKIAANQTRSLEDLTNLKRLLVKELSFMLSEYSEMLVSNPSLQLNTYFRINSVVPDASDAGRRLSRVMIKANRLKMSTGYLPNKNQKELTSSMDGFMTEIINSITSGVNVLSPALHDTQE